MIRIPSILSESLLLISEQQSTCLFNDCNRLLTIKINQNKNKGEKKWQPSQSKQRSILTWSINVTVKMKIAEIKLDKIPENISLTASVSLVKTRHNRTCWRLIKISHSQFFHIGKSISTNVSDNAV